jgi:hypothetical protein
MAVLVEGISVIVRAGAIVHKYDGGREAFIADCPDASLCADGELIRLGFMDPRDAQAFVAMLTERGLTDRADGEAVDLVIADQQRGLSVPCKWAELKSVPAPGRESEAVVACRLAGSDQDALMTPEGWAYEDSLSARFGQTETRSTSERLEFLRHEDGTDVYRDTETGEEVSVDRTGDVPDS